MLRGPGRAASPAADRAGALAALPADGQLPARRDRGDPAGRAARRGEAVDDLRDRGVDIDGVRRLGAEPVDDADAALRTAADALPRREGSWTDRLGQLVRDPSWQAVWDEQVTTSRRMLTELGRRTAFLAGRHVEIPEQHAGQPPQAARRAARDPRAVRRRQGGTAG